MPHRLRALALVGAALWLAASVETTAAAGLTEAARLSAVYDEILSARFDRARDRLATACPPAPSEACLSLRVALLWWQIVLDPDSRALDGELEAATTRAVAANDAWTRREPGRAEAWFYLAASSAPFVQLRVLRGQRLAAARDGNRIRVALERARTLDPSLHDAQFGIGLYHYYAGVAPAAAKLVRWLLLLPGGDRRQGLREMVEARDRGELLRGEADYQLHWLYLWYENQPRRALELLSGLDHRYPENPVFLQRLAEVHDDYFHDHPASAAAWTSLLDRATDGRVSAPALAATRARLGLAVQLDAMQETDRALAILRTVVQARPAAPTDALGRAHVLLGEAHDRLGDRAAAVAAYRAAIEMPAASEALSIWRTRARTNIRRTPDPVAAEAYRLSLEGWRAVERGDAAQVASALSTLLRARTLAPQDPTVAYRVGRAFAARGDAQAARGELERALAHADRAPAVIVAAACVEYAALLERSEDRAHAIALYERARSVVGADPRTRESAERALKRLAR